MHGVTLENIDATKAEITSAVSNVPIIAELDRFSDASGGPG